MIIAGAKGFAKEVLELALELNSFEEIVLYDDVSNDLGSFLYDKFPILKSKSDLKEYIEQVNPKFTLGLGSPQNRKKLCDILESLGGEHISVISDRASIGQFGMEIEQGVNIMQGVIITSNVKIGKGALLNINSTVGHDCFIQDFAEICPGVNISGNCIIGEYTFIGTNATILPGIRIGSNSIIGAGSLVTKDIPDNTLAYGNPAKPITKK